MQSRKYDVSKFFSFLIENQNDRKTHGIDSKDKLRTNIFAKLIAQKLFPVEKSQEVFIISDLIDIDKDGYVDHFDLDTFLKR